MEGTDIPRGKRLMNCDKTLDMQNMSMRTRKSENEKQDRQGFRPGKDTSHGGKTCQRIVCDNPVSREHNPFCSKLCKEMSN